MGGVDICDQQMEAYRTFFKTRKWTLKNATKGYTRFTKFSACASGALVADQTKTNVEWCSGSESGDVDLTPPSKRYRPADQPCPEKRLDGINHWPEESDLKSARMCRRKECKSRTRTRCTKCDVYLCLNKKKNCFTIYHTKK
ncbi:uncharacterized protein LOC120781503 [Bactrocera tryoni]|uniref:uncharacterized protein LOC120781503 n=1 Tax=Bactrocera tryoni TaxID=59916 RepID=UPI001A958C2E|nr:uncharacterized protein LOC120781503 [Bactrocera tryoni]